MNIEENICDFCNSKEGEPRPVGDYIVVLREVNIAEGKKFACQSCYRKSKKIKDKYLNKEQGIKKNWIKVLQKIGIVSNIF